MDTTLTVVGAEKAVAVFPNPEPQTQFPASDLVAAGTAVVFCFRRPGSGLCREQAEKAYARVIEMKAAGAVRVIALLKEDILLEVDEFKKHWPGDIFVDNDMEFYKALGGGHFHQQFNLVSYYAMLANPWSSSKTKKYIAMNKQKGYSSTMNGDDYIHGGVYVLRQDGSAAYAWVEEDMGDEFPIATVIKACKEAGTRTGSSYGTAVRSATAQSASRTSTTRTAGGGYAPIVVGTATTQTRTATTGTQQAQRVGTGTTQQATQQTGPQRTRTGTK